MFERARLSLVGLASLVLVPALAVAQPSRTVTVQYDGATLGTVASAFTSFSKHAITIAPEIGEPVISGSVQGLEWRAALDRLLAPSGLVARPDSGNGLRIERERPITVEYQSAQLTDVVRAIARFSGHAIVVAPGVGDPPVTASLMGVDWQRGLDQILAPAGLVAEADATGVLRVVRSTR